MWRPTGGGIEGKFDCLEGVIKGRGRRDSGAVWGELGCLG